MHSPTCPADHNSDNTLPMQSPQGGMIDCTAQTHQPANQAEQACTHTAASKPDAGMRTHTASILSAERKQAVQALHGGPPCAKPLRGVSSQCNMVNTGDTVIIWTQHDRRKPGGLMLKSSRHPTPGCRIMWGSVAASRKVCYAAQTNHVYSAVQHTHSAQPRHADFQTRLALAMHTQAGSCIPHSPHHTLPTLPFIVARSHVRNISRYRCSFTGCFTRSRGVPRSYQTDGSAAGQAQFRPSF